MSDLFRCGGIDWKLQHPAAASNPAGSAVRSGQRLTQIHPAGFIGVETNKQKNLLKVQGFSAVLSVWPEGGPLRGRWEQSCVLELQRMR